MKIAVLLATALLTVAVAGCTSNDDENGAANCAGTGAGNGYGAGGPGDGGVAGAPLGGVDATSLQAETAELKTQVGDTIQFHYDSSDIAPEARLILQRQAAYMQKYQNLRFSIEGHCDERGTREYNLALGDRRANSARNALVSLGVDGQRLRTISYGKERPVAVGGTEAAFARNRRAVTVND